MEGILTVLFTIGIIYLIAIWIMKVLIRSASHVPTWEGIIVSAVLGMLPLYLFLCFFGVMGEKRKKLSDTTMNTGTYAEEMSRRYAYGNSTKEKTRWVKSAVFMLVAIGVLVVLFHRPKVEEVATPTETTAADDVVSKEKQDETPLVVEKELPVEKQAKKTGTQINKEQKSTLELLKEQNHASVVKQAKEADVSTEGSTLEILERINRKALESVLKY